VEARGVATLPAQGVDREPETSPRYAYPDLQVRQATQGTPPQGEVVRGGVLCAGVCFKLSKHIFLLYCAAAKVFLRRS
jgi:hypothetical protein